MHFPIAVPSSTVIAHDPEHPFLVWVIEQSEKHGGRLTLVGGRIELHHQNHLQCIHEEWKQEAGGLGASLVNPWLWAVKFDPYFDTRETTLGKLSHNLCPEAVRNLPVRGYYGSPDCLFVAGVDGTPAPSDGEAKRCFTVDVRGIKLTETPEESAYGCQHDLILALYRLYLQGRPVSASDFTDFKALRKMLLSL